MSTGEYVLAGLLILALFGLCVLVLKQPGSVLRFTLDVMGLRALLKIFSGGDAEKAEEGEHERSPTVEQRGLWHRGIAEALRWLRACLPAVVGGGGVLTVSVVVVVGIHGSNNNNSHAQQSRPGPAAHTAAGGQGPHPIVLTKTRVGGRDAIAWLATAPGIPLVGFATRRPGSGWKQLSVEWAAGARAEFRTTNRQATVMLASGCWEYGRPAHEGSPGRTVSALVAFPGTPSWLTSVAREELAAGSAVACAGKPVKSSLKAATGDQQTGVGLAAKGSAFLDPTPPTGNTTINPQRQTKPSKKPSPNKGEPGVLEN